MKQISDKVIEVMRGAIKLEIDGRAFFDHAAEVTQNELGKKMFRKLAQDEIDHLTTFRQLFSQIAGGDHWKRLIKEEEITGDSSLIQQLTLKVEEEQKKGEIGAIRMGMELEKKAIDFFEKSARETTDSMAKEVFERISKEEKLHYDLLQAQYDQVTNSGFWFDIAEFQMDGKY